MKGEMYVVQLIHVSSRARAVATGILGEVTTAGQLHRLRTSAVVSQLSHTFHCSRTEIFEHFAQRVSIAFQQRSLPSFTRASLKTLNEHVAIEKLSKVLQCRTQEVLGKLFNSEAMRKTLSKVDPHQEEFVRSKPEGMLKAILGNPISIEQMYGVGFNDWGDILQGESWLLPDAIKSLRNAAFRQNWPADDITRVLAACIEESHKRDIGSVLIGEDPQILDWLGLTFLRQRLQWLIIRLREQAVELAEDASRLAPSQSIITRLPMWLEMYERGAIYRSFPYFIAHKKPLSSFLARKTQLLSRGGEPDRSKGFTIANRQDYQLGNFFGLTRPRKYCTFEIHCFFLKSRKAVPILRLNGVPLSTAEHLISVIPKLSWEEISSIGDSVGEQLLNTTVLVPNRFLRFLTAGIHRLGPTFVQCLVLSGSRLPITLESPWRDDLTDRLPYRKQTSTGDTAFPKDVNAIVKDLRLQYRQAGKRLEVAQSFNQERGRH